jgi:AcrR family transcriptional regulator
MFVIRSSPPSPDVATRPAGHAPASKARPGPKSGGGRGSRRRAILVAAAQVISERGFADVRVADVAEAAGVSTGLVIYHFKTLDSLLIEALQLSEEDFRKAAARIIAAHAAPRDRFTELVRWALQPGEDLLGGSTLWIETWSQALRHPQIEEARAKADQAWRELLRSVVPDREPAQVDIVVNALAALLDGLAIQVALKDATVTPDVALELTLSVADSLLQW